MHVKTGKLCNQAFSFNIFNTGIFLYGSVFLNDRFYFVLNWTPFNWILLFCRLHLCVSLEQWCCKVPSTMNHLDLDQIGKTCNCRKTHNWALVYSLQLKVYKSSFNNHLHLKTVFQELPSLFFGFHELFQIDAYRKSHRVSLLILLLLTR